MKPARTTLGIALLCAAALTGLAQNTTPTAPEKVARVTAVTSAKRAVMLGDPVTVQPLTLQKTDFAAPAPWIWIFILVVVLFYFFYLARMTDILRNGPAVGGVKQAYSLGRSQMAWWMFIVLVSYVTIWMITGNRDTVTNSTLILVGISGATALGSVAIDATASSRIKTAIERLNTEKNTLQVQLATPGASEA